MTRHDRFGEQRTTVLRVAALIKLNCFSSTIPDSAAVARRIRDLADHRFGERALAEWMRYRIEAQPTR